MSLRLTLRALVVLATGCLGLVACGSNQNGLVEQGRELAQERACLNCHSTDGTRSIGPTWQGLYGSRVKLADGSTVTADEEYLRESILQPSAKTVQGFPEGLMETAIEPNSIPEEEVRALIAYMKSLR
jgi:cytochrome c oxidase subunit 2